MAAQSAIITNIEVFKISIPLKQPFVISLGPIYASENIVVRIHTDIGLVGTGECSPFPTIMGESQSSAYSMAALIAQQLKGKNALDLDHCIGILHRTVAFNYTIKGAFDMALYDLAAKHVGLPLYQFLGGKVDKVMETDITVTIDRPEIMGKEAKRYQSMGFPVLKVKLGVNGQTDVKRIAAIREQIGMDLPLRIDANQGWSVDEAVETLNALEAFNIQHCEAPVRRSDIFGLQKVHKESPIPIMADEALFNHHDAERLVQMQSCDLFNVKFAKSGGIANAIKILDIADQANIATQVGSMGESRYAITALTHFALTRSSIKYYDLDFPFLQSEDPVSGGIVYDKNWRVSLGDEPGVGAAFDEAFLKAGEWMSC